MTASSETDRLSVRGLPAEAERPVAIGRGPCIELPPANLITGGVFLVVGSRKALISQSGLRLAGTDRVWPLLINVQGSLFLPKSAATLPTNSPHSPPCRNSLTP